MGMYSFFQLYLFLDFFQSIDKISTIEPPVPWAGMQYKLSLNSSINTCDYFYLEWKQTESLSGAKDSPRDPGWTSGENTETCRQRE